MNVPNPASIELSRTFGEGFSAFGLSAQIGGSRL